MLDALRQRPRIGKIMGPIIAAWDRFPCAAVPAVRPIPSMRSPDMRSLPLLPALLVLACTGGEKSAADSAVAAAPPAPNVVNVVAKDFAFESPDTLPAGLTTFRMTNAGPAPHHVQLVRLDEGKTYAEFAAAIQSMQPGAPPPAWIHMVAGPNPGEVGQESNLTVSLQPGTYAMVCFVDVPDKVPHMAKGMMKEITVTPATGPAAAEPSPDVRITLKDYTWDITPALTSGHHVIRMENAGPQPHEVVMVKVAEGKTPEDVGKWAATLAGPPPFTFVGGASNMDPGQVAFWDVTLTPGTYMLICFFPDAKDGKPHADHGMVMPLTIG